MDLRIEKGPTGRIKRLRELLAGVTREDILAVLSGFSLESAASHGYAESTDYDLVHEGLKYPPKAALGLATVKAIGRPLTSDEFSGGEKSSAFAILDSLGFDIVRKIPASPTVINERGLERYRLYDRKEIAKIFEPAAEFSPGAGRWGIQGIVETPKDSGSFVFMVTLGVPFEGNPYQDALTVDGHLIWESQTQQNFESKAIRKFLVHDPQESNIHLFLRPNSGVKYTYLGLLEYFSHDPSKAKPVHFIWRIRNWDLSADDLDSLGLPVRGPLDPAFSQTHQAPVSQNLVRVPPPAVTSMRAAGGKRSGSRTAKLGSVDWAERDLRNRQLGLQGEKLVLRHEVEMLCAAGRKDLAAQVRHVALYNSAAGFDIESFRPDGSPKRIEVKTTQGPASTAFFISLNEVLASREIADSYSIYRVFDHRPDGSQVKFFELSGDVELSCGLVPVNFRAFPGKG